MTQVSAITFQHILKSLEQNTSISSDEMLEIAGLQVKDLEEYAYVQSQKLSDIFYYCMHKIEDNTLALKIGSSISYHSLGLLGYLMINTSNLQEMIEKFFYYQKLISGFMKFNLEENEDYCKLVIYINENPSIKVPSFHAEVHLTAILSILSQVLSLKLIPDKTHFTVDSLNNLEAYSQIFGKNIILKQEENAIFFHKRKLALPINHCNEQMLRYFESQANTILENLQVTSWYAKVKKEILKNIGEYNMSIDFIASKLNISSRVLQYYLKQESCTFREALLSVRMQLAQYYIKHTKMELNSLAYFLGYTESSSFFRAYKKYFNATPNMHRV